MNNIKIAEMRRKGEILFRTALNEGGTLSLGEVADLLNIPSSDAQERVENKSLLAVHFDGKLQFTLTANCSSRCGSLSKLRLSKNSVTFCRYSKNFQQIALFCFS